MRPPPGYGRVPRPSGAPRPIRMGRRAIWGHARRLSSSALLPHCFRTPLHFNFDSGSQAAPCGVVYALGGPRTRAGWRGGRARGPGRRLGTCRNWLSTWDRARRGAVQIQVAGRAWEHCWSVTSGERALSVAFSCASCGAGVLTSTPKLLSYFFVQLPGSVPGALASGHPWVFEQFRG